VVDRDPARAALTARLLADLAAQLGFRISDARVRIDAEAARRTGPRGARGLFADGVIWLHPDRYHPATAAGRGLLAHEATHLAQRTLPLASPSATAAPPAPAGRGGFAGTELAEAEAARVAADVMEGRAPHRPRVALAGNLPAADTGAATLPETAAPTRAEATPPADQAAQVEDAHAADIAAIRQHLDVGFFEQITQADVSYVLVTLDQYELGTAVAIMQAVGTPYRDRLADHLEPGHRRRHRRSVLACYGAMGQAERRRRDARLFEGMSLSELAPAERATLVAVLRDLSDQPFQELLAGDLRGQLLTVMQTPVEGDPLAEEQRTAVLALQARLDARQQAATARVREIRRRAGELLRSPDAEQARQALGLLRELLPAGTETGGAPTARPRSAALAQVVAVLEAGGAVQRLIGALPATDRVESRQSGAVLLEVIRHRPVAANLAHVQRLLSYGFTDWEIRDWEAWLAYQIVRRLPPEDQQRWRRLDNGKWFRRLADNMPEELVTSGFYQGVVVEPDEQGRLVDVASRIADTLASDLGRAWWERILAACREGINEARAPGLLIQIQSVGGPVGPPAGAGPEPARASRELPGAGREAAAGAGREPAGTAAAPAGPEPLAEAQQLELRRAVVLRLDQLGYASQIFARLPDRFLLQIDHLNLVRRIAALRDPEHLRRQVYELVGRNWWRQIPVFGFLFSEWSVSAHDAFVAFQLARLLPEADRAELAASGHWAAMFDAMTVEMRHSTGMHLFTDRDGRERDRLMERLRDNRLWRRERAAELRTLARMAIELGQRRFVFDRSRETRAFEVPELRPMVDAFRLYAEPDRTTYQPERLTVPAPEDLWGVLSNAFGWLWVKLRALGSILGRARLGLNAVGAEDLDLNQVQHLLSGELGGAVLAEPAARPGAGSAAAPGAAGSRAPGAGDSRAAEGTVATSRPPANRLTVLYHPRDGRLWLELPELQINSVNRVSAGLGIRTNRVTIRGLQAWATFPAQRLDQPVAVRLRLRQAEIADLLVTGDDLLAGVARIVLRTLALHLSRTGLEEPVPQPPGSDYQLPIPIIGPLIEFLVDLVRRIQYYQRTGRSIAQLQSFQATVDSVELEGIAYGADLTAGAARVENVFLGVGLNRGAYLRALREVLRRRLARARTRAEAAAVITIEQRIADTDRELGEIRARERRLGELHRKYVDDPSSLTEPERQEAAGLERELAGGTAVDIGRLELEGLSGDLRADRVALSGLTGDAATPLLTPHTAPLSSVFVTDQERIAQFRRAGPQRPPGVTGPVPLELRAEEGAATGLRYLGEIPIAASLEDQYAKLPPGTPDDRRALLRRLTDQVHAYQALDRRARGLDPPPLTPDERRALAEERERLRMVFGLQVASVAVQGIGADLLHGPSLTELLLRGGAVDSVTATGVEYGGYFRAEEVTGRRLAGGPIRRPPTPGAGERSGYRFSAEELRARGVTLDWAGNRAAEVGVTGLTGELAVRRAAPGAPASGYQVQLSAGSASVAGIDYRTGTAWIHSEGATAITGISLAGELNRRSEGGGGWVARVDRLHLDRTSADRLIFERNGPGDPYRVEITSGSLLNIDVRDLVYVIPGFPDPTAGGPTGRLEIGGLDQLRFQVALGALGSGSGVLSSVTETGAPRTTGMLTVRLAADGPQAGEEIDLTGLVLTEGEVRTRSGRVRIRRLEVGASVHHSGDTWTIRSLTIPQLGLGSLRWRTADGAVISSTGGAGLTGLRARGTIITPPGAPMRVRVEELDIAAITATHLRYRQDPIDITVGPRSPSRAGRPPLEIRDIKLRDFQWSTGAAPTGGLTVGSAAVEFQGQLAEHLQAGATINLSSLRATFTEAGHVVLRARGSADADISHTEPGVAGSATPAAETSMHVTVDELDTGVVDIGGNAIEFGPGRQPGLEIRELAVDRIDYRSPDLQVETMAGGRGAVLHRPHARLRIDLRTEAERRAAGGPAASAIRRIVLREVGIDSIELDGIRLTLPRLVSPDRSGAARPVQVWLPPGEPGVLRGINLVLPSGGAELAAPASATGSWVIPELHLRISGETDPDTGTRTAPALLLPRLRASVAGILTDASARVATDQIDVRLLSGGGTEVDLRRPSITAIEALFSRSPLHRLRIAGLAPVERPEAGGVRAEHVSYRSRSGELTITELGLNRLRYVDADAGVEITVDRATLPGDVRTTLPAPGRGLSGRIPELNIEGAWFRVDFTAGTPAPATPTPPSRHPWTDRLRTLGPFQQVFDSLQGNLGLTLRQTYTGWFRENTPINLAIVNGQLDYYEIERQVIKGWRALLYFELRRRPRPELWLLFESPISHNDALGEGMKLPVAVWSLDTDEFRQADRHSQIRIWRLLNLEGPARVTLDEPATPSTGPSGPSPVELRGIDALLSVRSARPIPIDLGAASGGKVTGTVTLARNALADLHVTGQLPGGTGLQQTGLAQARVDSLDLRVPGTVKLGTGAITIDGVRDLDFRMSPSWDPQLLSGRVTRAQARNITWRVP
jgi:hypothetical protein